MLLSRSNTSRVDHLDFTMTMITTEAGCCQKRGKLVQFAGLGIVKDVWAAETVLCVRNVYAICHEVMAWVEDLDTQGNGAKAELVVSWLHGN